MSISIRQHWLTKPLLLVGVLSGLLNFLPQGLGVKPAYLWTDKFILLLVVMLIIIIAYIRRQEHLCRPWRQVFQRRISMAAIVFLLAYLVVGLLDSVHFRLPLPAEKGAAVHYSVEVKSLLDIIAADLDNKVEKTYSAPFATHLFSRESVDQPNGGSIRIYPRLKYGGVHLKNPETDKHADIFKRLFLSMIYSLGLMIVLLLFIAKIFALRDKKRLTGILSDFSAGRLDLPWRTATMCVWLILFFIFFIADAGHYYHILGTDKVGQDVLYLAIKSIRTGLVIGTLTTLVMLPFAIFLGVAAGFFRGWIDDVIQYIYTTLNSIPGVLLIAAAILSIDVYIANHPDMFATTIERADLRLLALCFILGITSWTGLCRLLRGESFKLRELEYIQAAEAFGVKKMRIIRKHIIPNISHIVLIVVVLDFSGLVLAEAVLSYVGVGVDPSTNSWGNMINGARLEMGREPMVWWSLVAAFSFMFILVLSANLFSDAVRDAFDPYAQRK